MMASPTLSSSDAASSSSMSNSVSSKSSSDADIPEPSISTKCGLCHETFTIPKVLNCFHSFCQHCLEKHIDTPDRVVCPVCQVDTYLNASGIAGLLPDFAISNLLQSSALDTNVNYGCTGCKSKDLSAVARCFDCANFLCPNCVMAHQFMHCFEGHRVMTLGELESHKSDSAGRQTSDKLVNCSQHRQEYLAYFCRTCDLPICKECIVMEHSGNEHEGKHDVSRLAEVGKKECEFLRALADQAKAKANDLRGSTKSIEHSNNRLQIQHQKAQNEVNETYSFYRSLLEERKGEAIKELESAFNAKQVSLTTLTQRLQDSIEKLYQGSEFIDKLLRNATTSEILLFKKLINTKLQNIINFTPDINSVNIVDLEFVSNYQAIQVGVRNTFGYIRQGNETNGVISSVSKPLAPIARPTSFPSSTVNSLTCNQNSLSLGINNITNSYITPTNGNIYEPSNLVLSKSQFPSNSSLTTSSSLPPQQDLVIPTNGINYEKWSSGMDIVSSCNTSDIFSTSSDPIIDITSKLISANIYPPKSQIKRQKMIYHCKFGEFGVMDGQFTEPSGVAVNTQNDIIVADTNNHRIQIFDREGRFKFQFGECGKHDGQLLYPNRVAAVKSSGDIIVTERSPTHQIQIYNQYGQFVRKFGANILQHPRGVTVDSRGRIIIVECKVMRVIIFDQLGNVLHKFGCSKYLEFPNGVVVNDKEEIFISDNRAHCVKVFNYQGLYLRQIGGEGVTNYPIGVGINSHGEVLIADNHNNFNLTSFSQDGQLISALESKVKHAQCFDVELMDEGSIVLASKDYRLYIYRYAQIPMLGL